MSEPIYMMRATDPVYSLLFQDEYLLAGTQDGTVSLWDLKTHRTNAALSLKCGSSACVKISYADHHLITQDREGSVRWWSKSESMWLPDQQLQLSYCGFCKIDTNHDFGGIIACPQNKSDVEIFTVNSAEKICTFSATQLGLVTGLIMICKFIRLAGNVYLLTVYESGAALLWDIKTSKTFCHFMFDGLPMTLDFDDEHNRGICGASTNRLQLFEFDESQNVSILFQERLQKSSVGVIKINPERTSVFIGGGDGKLRYFVMNPFHPLGLFTMHSKAIEEICFSKTEATDLEMGYMMATGGADCRILLWKF